MVVFKSSHYGHDYSNLSSLDYSHWRGECGRSIGVCGGAAKEPHQSLIINLSLHVYILMNSVFGLSFLKLKLEIHFLGYY